MKAPGVHEALVGQKFAVTIAEPYEFEAPPDGLELVGTGVRVDTWHGGEPCLWIQLPTEVSFSGRKGDVLVLTGRHGGQTVLDLAEGSLVHVHIGLTQRRYVSIPMDDLPPESVLAFGAGVALLKRDDLEIKIRQSASAGLRAEEIASLLGISKETVTWYLRLKDSK